MFKALVVEKGDALGVPEGKGIACLITRVIGFRDCAREVDPWHMRIIPDQATSRPHAQTVFVVNC